MVENSPLTRVGNLALGEIFLVDSPPSLLSSLSSPECAEGAMGSSTGVNGCDWASLTGLHLPFALEAFLLVQLVHFAADLGTFVVTVVPLVFL